MKRSVCVVFSFLVLCGAAPQARAQTKKKVVVVLPFTSPTRYNLMGRNAQSTFITALVKTRKLRVIQGAMVRKMMRRYRLRWAGTLDPRLMKAAGSYLKATHVLAGTYWMSYAKALDVFPYEERVWNTHEVQPINDHGYARDVPPDAIKKNFHKGAGAEPVPMPLATMDQPSAGNQASPDGGDSLLGDDGIDWDAPP